MNEQHQARIMITRPQRGDGRDVIAIRIVCDRSQIRIVEVEMEPADFLLAMMGRGDMRGEITEWDHAKAANVGKELVTERLFINRHPSYCKDAVSRHVRAHPLVIAKIRDGWELESDGTDSRQSGDQHVVWMRKYVEATP